MTVGPALAFAALAAPALAATRPVESSAPGARAMDVRSTADERPPGSARRLREDWLLSLEAVTRVPVDAGAQVGLETPFGLRIFGGYGWVPYLDLLTNFVVSADDRDLVGAFLNATRVSGDSARVVLGLRPFRRLGTYLDASYAHLRLATGVNVPPLRGPGFEFPGGRYDARTALDLWAVELGYQGEVAERIVLGGALGISGAIDSRTSITPIGAAPNDPALPAAARRVDRTFQTHVLPTLTLRVGFDGI